MTLTGRALFLWVAVANPGVAFAHSPIEGIDSFYNGLLHPVFVPAHLLLLISLGLFFGQKGPRENQSAISVFLVAMLVGIASAWFLVGDEMERVILVGAAIVGLSIASDLAVKTCWYWPVAALAGFSLGLDSAQETLSGREKLLSLLGSAVGISLLLVYPMALANYYKTKNWQKIGVRVIGSWVAASSLLVLALSFSTRS